MNITHYNKRKHVTLAKMYVKFDQLLFIVHAKSFIKYIHVERSIRDKKYSG